MSLIFLVLVLGHISRRILTWLHRFVLMTRGAYSCTLQRSVYRGTALNSLHTTDPLSLGYSHYISPIGCFESATLYILCMRLT